VTPEEAEKKEHARTKEAISAMASRHNARIDWEKSPVEGTAYKGLFTFQIEDTLVRDPRPIVGFGSVDDITKENGRYSVHFRDAFHVGGPDIRFVLECSPQQVESILGSKSHSLRPGSIFEGYAFVASLSSVNRPAFEVRANPINTEEAEVAVESSDVFHVARGKCLELLFVGDYNFPFRL